MNREAGEDGNGYMEDEYHMSSGGVDNVTGDFIDWPRLDLSVGDRIEFEILESSNPFPPATRRSHGGDAAAFSKKDYIRSMANEFGWEIIEHESYPGTNQSDKRMQATGVPPVPDP